MRTWFAIGLGLLLLVGMYALGGIREQPASIPLLETDGATSREGLGSQPELVGTGTTARIGGSEVVRSTKSSEGEQESATRKFFGVVVNEAGEIVAGASVFARNMGATQESTVHTRTNADGQWSLNLRGASNKWIGVVANGFLPLHSDIEESTKSSRLRLVVSKGPELILRMQGAQGESLELGSTIFLVPTAKAAKQWPGPGDAWDFEQEIVIPAGNIQARTTVGSIGEVIVSPSRSHTSWIISPGDQTVLPEGQTLTFTVTRSCIFDIRVLDAIRGEPLSRSFSYSVLKSGVRITGGARGSSGGRARINGRIRPGTYTVRVSALGYIAVESKAVTLSAPGDKAVIEVQLDRDPTLGGIRLSLPTLATLPASAKDKAASPSFLWKRSTSNAPLNDRETSSWGNLDGRMTRQSDTDFLFEGIGVGELSMVAVEPQSGHVAIVKSIPVREGRTHNISIDLGKGIRFDSKDVMPVGDLCRSFRVLHPFHEELPTWSFRVDGAYWLKPGVVPPREHKIGPYPGPAIEVEIVLKDGTKKTKTFP